MHTTGEIFSNCKHFTTSVYWATGYKKCVTHLRNTHKLQKQSYFPIFNCCHVDFCTGSLASYKHYLASSGLINSSMYMYLVLSQTNWSDVENMFKDFQLKRYITIPISSHKHSAVRKHIHMCLHKSKYAWTHKHTAHYIEYIYIQTCITYVLRTYVHALHIYIYKYITHITYIYTYIHTYIHTHTHTYTYICIPTRYTMLQHWLFIDA